MEIRIKNLKEMEKFGKFLSDHLKNKDVVSLKGDLGAGKTTLTNFIGKGLNISDYITSPTFNIVNSYYGDKELNHLDLYRIENPLELERIDYENYFYPEGISIIEWAKNGGYYIPEDIIEIEIKKSFDETGRIVDIKENSRSSPQPWPEPRCGADCFLA